MAIRVALQHRTTYRFDRSVGLGPHEIRLRPAPHCRTPILGYSLQVAPDRYFLNWQQDPYGNWVARLVFTAPADKLEIVVDLTADMTVINPFDFFVEPYAEFYPFGYAPALAKELIPFLETAPTGPLLLAWLDRFRPTIRPGEKTVDMLVRLNQQLQGEISYLVRMEPGVQPPDETLERARGSCRDTGWLLVQILRHLGLAARFASGYLIQLVADVKPLHGPAGPEHDFTDLHAWAEVFLPGAGWIGLDPTSGLLAGEGHIPLACTADPGNAAPVIGYTDVCGVELSFAMHLARVHEDPRVTKPYSDAQWAAIQEVARQVDDDLARQDVRLTQGGEPTFVSADDMDGPEWNHTALSPKKRELAETLLRRLAGRFSRGGFLHSGQGKWYPGEPLPRWAIGIWWRADGEPLWRDPALIADTRDPGSADIAAGQRFAERLAERLGLDAAHVITAFEDVPKLLAAEAALPPNADPLAVDLTRPDERARLARLLLSGLDRPAGFILPLRAAPAQGSDVPRWRSSAWPLKRERLYALPGDSPLGLRLPLASLPEVLPADIEPDPAVDPFAPRGELPAVAQAAQRRAKRVAKPAAVAPKDVVKTALCVEVRDGHIHVFMPPLTRLEDYVGLIGAIEDTAKECRQPVAIEGYTPPRDPRVRVLNVTPDPGVIEVNIHPASSWDELVATTEALYEEAREARLSTEKFMLDGRHTGTGGGNHVTLGGASAADSPLLRRPDLLQSLITYWQNHPALSYLFSGTFIGPTSQSPRVDEARDDRLYELEIAFQQMNRKHKSGAESTTPWLVDRLLRHLLTDLTGNTHRAEFSIDKLYSPDSPTGRLGLLEFRAFEMPPHARMSLVQTLLLRALVARFWREPYRGGLVRWGTALHDRWLLPHFVGADIRDVVGDLAAHGYPMAQSWFDPFVEFRFPRFGTVTYDGVTIELRQAIEPWHVLGEEVSGTGTARYVDSSVERLQVKVNGITGARHRMACNGRALPLTPTGIPGEYVAGVRFRAWNPPSALHPTIDVQAPLVFDLVDAWAGRALGGCTYHVSHPGGRSYDTFPVNANEAEARRFARFWAHGHTPGAMTLTDEPPNPATPTTLDLRWNPQRR
ncbi:MAG: transglutaminase family protein, partial [Betaproteobacteria bacterium]|nr:transglutaminase family protein [Betaproteobacteria bacterium]